MSTPLYDRYHSLEEDRDNLLTALRMIRFYLGGRDGTEPAHDEAALRGNTEKALKIVRAALSGERMRPEIAESEEGDAGYAEARSTPRREVGGME